MAKRRYVPILTRRDWQPGDIARCLSGDRIHGQTVTVVGELTYDVMVEPRWHYPVTCDISPEPGSSYWPVAPLDLHVHPFKTRQQERP